MEDCERMECICAGITAAHDLIVAAQIGLGERDSGTVYEIIELALERLLELADDEYKAVWDKCTDAEKQQDHQPQLVQDCAKLCTVQMEAVIK